MGTYLASIKLESLASKAVFEWCCSGPTGVAVVAVSPCSTMCHSVSRVNSRSWRVHSKVRRPALCKGWGFSSLFFVGRCYV